MENQFDLLWKSAIEEMPTDAIRSLFRTHAHQIDFSRGVEFMDKELRAIIQTNRKKMEGHRHVDFLVKVWLLNGQEQWILIHLEVQSQPDGNFEERMFVYYIRIKQKYKCSVASLAVLADSSKKFRPSKYQESCFDTRLSFSFPSLKIIDLDE
jgi:hypothetical protein